DDIAWKMNTRPRKSLGWKCPAELFMRNLRRTGVVYRALAGETPIVETGLAWRTRDVSPVLAGFIEIVRRGAPA
ncbi:MAG: hypothetical protein VB141_05960, partial [Burkholderia gladioli]